MDNQLNLREHRKALINILQMAFSGEKAAALAYAGHWRAARDPQEKIDIWKIEQEEWEHRAIVGEMLKELQSAPLSWREALMSTIGSIIFLGCFVGGWFFPMYFAGLLENSNVDEYKEAAKHASALGMNSDANELMRLSAIELRHEEFFKAKVCDHPWTKFLIPIFHWGSSNREPVKSDLASANNEKLNPLFEELNDLRTSAVK